MALIQIEPYVIDITGDFTFNNVTATGNLSALNANLGNIAVANLFTGTLTTSAQPNITSVGTLGNLSVTSNISAGNVKTDNLLYANGTAYVFTTNAAGTNTQVQFNDANSFAGSANFTFDKTTNTLSVTNIAANGAGLTSITGANVTGAVAYATTANSVAGANVSGQVGNSAVAGTVYTNAQPNITSVGTLTDLSVSGNAVVSGNLTVSGNTTYINVETVVVEDPIIELGSGVNGAPLTTDDGKDRGTLLHYYTSAPVDAFMGWDNSNGEFAFGSNVSVSSEVVTFNSLGNVRASYFIGNGSQLTGISATSSANANYANYAGNAFSVSGSNVSGQVANALVAGTVYTNAQPNITSVGTLTSLDVTGNITAGNVTAGSGSGGNITGANLVSANFFTGTLTTAAQPNITSVGTLSNITSTGTANFIGASNVSLGPVANVHITGGTSGQYLQTDGSGTLSWATVSSGSTSNISNGNSNVNIPSANGNVNISAEGNANVVVVTGTGANINGTLNVTGNATVGNLITSGSGGNISNANVISANTFTASGNITAGNANLGNSVTANYFVGTLYGTANLATYATTANSVAGANVTGAVSYATTANSVAVANVSGIGNIATVNLDGSSSTVLYGNGSWATISIPSGTSISNGNSNVNIPSANGNVNISAVGNANVVVVTGTGANIAGTLNVTGNATVGNLITSGSGGNISNANVISANTFTASGNITAGNANLGNAVTANYFVGNGSLLTGISATSSANANYANYAGNAFSVSGSNVSGQVANALVAGTVYTNAQPNITSVGTLTSLDVTGNITAGNVTAGSGSGGNITGANLVSANFFTGTLTTAAQPNITSVGTLGNLSVTSNVSAGNVKTDNLLYANGTAYVFTTNAAGSNTQVQFNDANAFAGSANFSFDKTTNTLSVTNISANGAGLTSITGANVTGAVAYATTANSVAGANVSGQVANALVAGTVYTNAQPNITSVGTLGNLTVAGNITAGNVVAGSGTGGNITGADLISANFFTGTLTTAAQPNITSVGTLTGITSTGTANFTSASNVSLGPVANVHISGGTSGQYLQTDGSGTLSWATVSSGAASNISNGNSNVNIPTANGNVNISAEGNANVVVVTGTGANVSGTLNVTGTATVGNLVTSGSGGNISNANVISANTFTASGNITAGNANLGNAVVANYFTGNFYGTANLATYATTANAVALANVSGIGNIASINLDGSSSNVLYGNGAWATISIPSGSSISNGNSNVNIPSANGNVNISAEGNANVVVVNGTGITITGSIETTDYIHTTGSANIDGLLTVSSSDGNNPNKGIAFPLPPGSGADSNASIRYYHYGSYSQTVLEIGVGNNLIFASGQDSINFVSSGGVGVKTLTPTVEFEVTGRAKVSGNTEIGGILIATGNANFTGANVSLGSVANLKITGGTANYVLQTDGAGNLSWAAQSGGGGASNISNGNSNVSISTANGNITLSAVGNANILVVTGTGVNVAGTFNATGNIIGANANLGNAVTANYFVGNGSLLTGIDASTANSVAGANVTGQVGNSLIAGTVYTNAQPNITSVGSLTGLTVSNSTGIVDFTTTANVTLGNVSNLHITGGNANYVLTTDGAGNLSWAAAGSGSSSLTSTTNDFTGDGSNASFTLSSTPVDENYTFVSIAGLFEPRTTYTVSGNIITFSEAPPDGAPIEVTVLSSNGGGGGGGGGITAQDLLSPFLLMGA